MKLLIPFLLLCSSAQADVYLKLGIGWIDQIPAKVEIEAYQYHSSTIILSKEAQITIESPFTEIGIGYEKNTWHVELNRFGVLDDSNRSISTLKLYKNFYFE